MPSDDKFIALSKPEQSLKPGRTLPQLKAIATAINDHEAVRHLNAAKHQLDQAIVEQNRLPA